MPREVSHRILDNAHQLVIIAGMVEVKQLRERREAEFERLDELRLARAMKSQEWARLAGVALNTIHRYRMGDRIPSDEMLVKLRVALGLPALAEVTTAN